MTFGPRTTTSPASPAGSSLPSESTTATSTSGSGSPTVPGLRTPCSGFAVQHTVHSDSP
jgi:hypothetical protein